jgi:hypothetical protein
MFVTKENQCEKGGKAVETLLTSGLRESPKVQEDLGQIGSHNAHVVTHPEHNKEAEERIHELEQLVRELQQASMSRTGAQE